MDHDEIEPIAVACRQQLFPGVADHEALPLRHLDRDFTITTLPLGVLTGRIVTHFAIPEHLWGITTFELEQDRAWIWLNRDAWPEHERSIPRTRFTVAHELGHVVLHGEEIVGLMCRAESDHKDRLEREANLFAAHLLIPDAARKRLEPGDLDAMRLAARFQVTIGMATHRLREWGL